jgi:NAD(P)-dependent dehydrogenase (short-subunit alcohol dehydrogenase family)
MSELTKPVLVTGANKGIGLATVKAILNDRDDTRVFLGSRSIERGEEARREIVDDEPAFGERVELVQLDVSDNDSVKSAAEIIATRLGGDPLYGVVNNAGIGDSNPLDKILDVNVYGPKRVCDAFLPLIAHPDGRVVNVSSASGPKFVAECHSKHEELLTNPEITWSDIEEFINHCVDVADGDLSNTDIGNGSAYGLSKACLNAYTICLARENPDLTINACTPGFIETDMTRPMAKKRGKDPEEVGMKPPEKGTTAQMFLLFGEPDGSGWYFGSDAERSPLHRYRSPGDPPYTGGE